MWFLPFGLVCWNLAIVAALVQNFCHYLYQKWSTERMRNSFNLNMDLASRRNNSGNNYNSNKWALPTNRITKKISKILKYISTSPNLIFMVIILWSKEQNLYTASKAKCYIINLRSSPYKNNLQKNPLPCKVFQN